MTIIVILTVMTIQTIPTVTMTNNSDNEQYAITIAMHNSNCTLQYPQIILLHYILISRNSLPSPSTSLSSRSIGFNLDDILFQQLQVICRFRLSLVLKAQLFFTLKFIPVVDLVNKVLGSTKTRVKSCKLLQHFFR